MIDAVRLTADVARRLIADARAAAPRECCGLLVGTGDLIDECVATANLDPDPSRFLVDPAAHINLNRQLRGSSRAVVGVYHSHPRGPARPSPSDVAEAHYPEFVHVIVSALDRPAPELAGYRIIRGIVTTLRVEVSPAARPS